MALSGRAGAADRPCRGRPPGRNNSCHSNGRDGDRERCSGDMVENSPSTMNCRQYQNMNFPAGPLHDDNASLFGMDLAVVIISTGGSKSPAVGLGGGKNARFDCGIPPFCIGKDYPVGYGILVQPADSRFFLDRYCLRRKTKVPDRYRIVRDGSLADGCRNRGRGSLYRC